MNKRIALGILGGAILAACSHAGGPSPLPAAFAPQSAMLPDASGFKTLYSFGSLPDGESPTAGLVALDGTLYGTTQVGGKGAAGTVYATSTAGKEHVVYSFGSNNPDGLLPIGALFVSGGVFYGTASTGGANGFGAVFKVDKSGDEHLIYSFKGGNDGGEPYAGLIVYKGALYGTTIEGGGSSKCVFGCGTVFAVTTAGKEHVVYAFKGGNDGSGPVASLIAVGSSLYGTTPDGGKHGVGTIFKTNTSGHEQVLHSFGAGFDGAEPEGALINVGGTLYGTTNNAGKKFNGTVFSATTGGGEKVLYSFKGGKDGANPEAALVAVKGTLYGTTAGGGTPGLGTVFSVSTTGHEHMLHAFASSEGSDPRAPLVAVNATLYGTTSLGGANSVGTIFKISP